MKRLFPILAAALACALPRGGHAATPNELLAGLAARAEAPLQPARRRAPLHANAWPRMELRFVEKADVLAWLVGLNR